MNGHKNKIFMAAFLLLSVLFLGVVISFNSCAGQNDEAIITGLVKEMARLAEKRDSGRLINNFDEDYTDFEGRDRKKTEEMLENYFKSYRGIVIHLLSTRVDNINVHDATVRVEIALSSGGAEVFRKLIRVSLDNYRIEMRLAKKEERWRVRYASWQYVALDELFPESLSLLKKLFPDI